MPKQEVPSISFTYASIDALTPPQHGEAVYRDKTIPQLYLRIRPSGRKTFSLVLWMSHLGKTHREPVGTFPAMVPDVARKEAKKILAKLTTGVMPSQERKNARQRMKFSALFEDYMDAKGSKKKTSKEMQANFERYLRRPLADRPANEITRADLAGLHRAITKTGAPVAANRALALVSSVYGWAIKAGHIETNPASHIEKNRERRRERFILPAELDAFYCAVEAETPVMRDFVLLSVYTGQRRSNVLAARWSQIDFITQTWRIPDTKNGTSHDVPLPDAAVQLLEQRWNQRESDFVFPGDGKTGHLVEPKKGWERIKLRMHAVTLRAALLAAGTLQADDPKWNEQFSNEPHALVRELRALAAASDIEVPELANLRIHDLRRTNGSYLAMSGASLPMIGKVLNHKDPRSTQIYARLHYDAPRDAMEAAIDAMENKFRTAKKRVAA